MGVFVIKAQHFKKLLPSTNKTKIKICGQSRALKFWVNQPSVTSVSLIIYSIWILLCDCRSLSLMIVFEQQHDSSMHFFVSVKVRLWYIQLMRFVKTIAGSWQVIQYRDKWSVLLGASVKSWYTPVVQCDCLKDAIKIMEDINRFANVASFAYIHISVISLELLITLVEHN